LRGAAAVSLAPCTTRTRGPSQASEGPGTRESSAVLPPCSPSAPRCSTSWMERAPLLAPRSASIGSCARGSGGRFGRGSTAKGIGVLRLWARRGGGDGKRNGDSGAGERRGGRPFGHLGFTGTSLWIDPDAKVVVTLLTNRL